MSHSNRFLQPQRPQSRSGPSWGLVTLAVLGGGALLLVVLCCGGAVYIAQPPRASAAASEPFNYADVPQPQFPDRGPFTEMEPGVMHQKVLLGGQGGGYYGTPGHGGYLYLYLPPGKHQPRTLPGVLITGAGSNLLSGMHLSAGDQPEHTPYVKAGFAVLAYELDGPNSNDEDVTAMQKAFDAFKASRAGLVNARNALEYALAKVPEIDPARIYSAGHSSAATHCLLFAEHEPRLAGVIAYAPAVDLPQWFGPRLRLTSLLMRGSVDFITQSSPSTHRQRLKCPTFLFHAEDDSICEISQTRSFADELERQGTATTLVTVPAGEHYDSMINQGIPAAIKWLQERGPSP
jgi:dipeptidyl aminopeptidase/acylaminoacyl peptidase